MDEVQAIAARLVAREHGGPRGPWTLEVYPTLRCNLDCAFCDTTERHRPPQHELDEARWLEIVDEAAALGARHLMVLGGGEPLLAAATLPLMRRAKAHGLSGMLTTNGTRLGPDRQRVLAEIGWDEVQFSVDGASAHTHDALRGRRGAFHRTVSAICQLRRLPGAPEVVLHTVVTRRNLHELVDIVRLAAAVGARRVEFDAVSVYRPEQAVLDLRPEDRARLPALVGRGQELAARLGVRTTLGRLLAPEATHRGARRLAPGAGEGLGRAPCLRAWHHLVVQADGRTSPCCVLAGLGESVARTAVDEVWERSDFLAGVRAGMLEGRAAPGCAWCSENILAHERNIRAALP